MTRELRMNEIENERGQREHLESHAGFKLSRSGSPKANAYLADNGRPKKHLTINDPLDYDERVPIKQIEANLKALLLGRVRNLRLIGNCAGVVLKGQATSFYLKQLAQHEFMKATACPLLVNEIQVLQQLNSPQGLIR